MGCGGGRGDDRVESGMINEVTKGVDRSIRGKQDKDARVCITCNGGIGKSSEVSKVRV